MDNWVTYSGYKINLTNPTATFGLIFTVLFLLIIITLKRNENSFFDISTTTSMKGIAVLFLIFGHLSKCIQNKLFFNLGGYWAVIIFLFLSGFGLYQRHKLQNIKFGFWKNRILKLYIPLWMTLVVFITLDYFLINLRHPIFEIVLNFIGIHFNNIITRVNAVAWFVEYIMVLYFLFWTICNIRFSEEVKLILLFVLCTLISAIVYLTPIKQYHSIWVQYTIVFPTGVLFGKYQHPIRDFLTRLLISPAFLILPSLILFIIFYNWNSVFSIPGDELIRPLALVASIIFIAALLETTNLQSRFLLFLGQYSYEIYLLHAPFMIKYDFFLHRDPLFIYFYVYFFSVVILSILLAKVSNTIRSNIINMKT